MLTSLVWYSTPNDSTTRHHATAHLHNVCDDLWSNFSSWEAPVTHSGTRGWISSTSGSGRTQLCYEIFGFVLATCPNKAKWFRFPGPDLKTFNWVWLLSCHWLCPEALFCFVRKAHPPHVYQPAALVFRLILDIWQLQKPSWSNQQRRSTVPSVDLGGHILAQKTTTPWAPGPLGPLPMSASWPPPLCIAPAPCVPPASSGCGASGEVRAPTATRLFSNGKIQYVCFFFFFLPT